MVLVLILEHDGALVFRHGRGLRQVVQQRVPVDAVAVEQVAAHQPGGQLGDGQEAAGAVDVAGCLMGHLGADQRDADRHLGDAGARDVPQAGHLHLVPGDRAAVLRHHHHGHLAAGLLQRGQEAVQLIQQGLQPRLVGRYLAVGRIAVAVVQGDQVEEGDVARRLALLPLAQPVAEHVRGPVDGLSVEGGEIMDHPLLAHEGRVQTGVLLQILEVVAEGTGVIHGHLLLEAELGQVVEQQALARRRHIEPRVAGLPATGSQQADGGRAAVGGRRVEMLEHDVEVTPDRVLRQAARLHVAPGQGADVDDQHVEGGRLGGQLARELHQTIPLLPVKVVEVGVEVLIGGRRTLIQLLRHRGLLLRFFGRR
ncbi:hypothetical protein D3C79_629650 [compost metagenome]